jgi:hypothetical protein
MKEAVSKRAASFVFGMFYNWKMPGMEISSCDPYKKRSRLIDL